MPLTGVKSRKQEPHVRVPAPDAEESESKQRFFLNPKRRRCLILDGPLSTQWTPRPPDFSADS